MTCIVSLVKHDIAGLLSLEVMLAGEGLPNGHFREDPAAQAVQSSSFPGHSQAQYEQQQAASQPEGLPGQPGQEGEFPGKQVSTGDIQRVQNYIERCLQLYLSQKEVRRPLCGARSKAYTQQFWPSQLRSVSDQKEMLSCSPEGSARSRRISFAASC